MPGLQELKILESDPEFWQFSYTDQLKIRQRVLSKVLPEEPGFDQLNQVQQALVYRRILLSPPKFENPDFQRFVENALKDVNLADPEGSKSAIGPILSNSLTQRMGIVKLVAKLLDPLITQMGRGPDNPTQRWALENIPDSMTAYEYHFGKDGRKLVQYLHAAAGGQLPDLEARRRRMTSLGLITDWAAFTALTGGATFGVGPLGEATIKAGAAAERLALRHGLTWMKHLAPHLVIPAALQAGIEGGGDVLRDWLSIALDKGEGIETVERSVWDVARIFGLGAGRDFAFGFLGSVMLPVARGVPQVIRRYADANEVIRKSSDEALMRLLTAEAAGKGIPNRVLRNAPDHMKERVAAFRGIKASLDDFSSVRPGSFKEMQIQSWNAAHSLVRTSDGYILRPFNDPGAPVKAANLREVREALTEAVGKMADKKILSANPLTDPLVAQYEMNKLVNYAFDPLGTVEKTQPEIRARRRAIKKGEYVSPAARQYLNPAEIDIAAQRASKQGASTYRVRAEDALTPDEITSFGKGQQIDTYNRTWTTGVPLDDADTLIVSARTAPFSEYQAALALEGDTDVILLRHGYDAAFTNAEHTKLLSLRSNGVKFSSSKVNPATGKWTVATYTAATPRAAVRNAGNELFIRQKISAKIPIGELGGDEQLMSRLLASGLEGGNIDQKVLRDFAAVYLAKRGISPTQYKDLVIQRTASKAATRSLFENGEVILGIPEKLPSAGAERVFIRSLVDQLEQLSDRISGGIKAPTKASREAASAFLSRYGEVLKKGRIWSTMWGGEEAARKYLVQIGQKSGKFASLDSISGKVQLYDQAGNVVRSFSSMNEAYEEIIPAIMNRGDVERVASFNRARLRKVNDTYQIFSFSEGKVIGTGTTPAEALKASGLDYKIPARHMPKIVTIDEGAAHLQFDALETRATSVQEAFRLLDQYDISYSDAKLAFSSDKINAYKVGAQYIVEDTTMGHWKSFKSLGEAKSFYSTALQDTKKSIDIFAEKSMDVKKVGNEYDVVIGGRYYHAATEEELRRLMRLSPLPKEMPELVDINGDLGEIPEFLNQQASYFKGVDIDFKGGFKPVNWLKIPEAEAAADLPLRLTLTSGFRPVDDAIIQMVKYSGHKPIVDNFLEMEDALRGGEREAAKYLAMVERSLQVPSPKGKLHIMPKPRRQALYQFMTAKPEEAEKVAKALKITAAERGAADKLRTVLGRDRNSGLFAIFIDDPNTFIFDYLPRFLRDYKNMPKKILLSSKKNIDIVNQIAGNRYVPNEIKFSANEERLADILNIAVDDDVLSVMKKYITLGMKRTWVGPVWKNFKKYMNANWANIPAPLRQAVTIYQQQVLGIPQSFGLKQMRDVGDQLSKKLGIEKIAGDNLISSYFGLTYWANMGYRPWLVYRNMHQIFTTLAPKFGIAGNEVVSRAAIKATQREGQLMYEHLQEIGTMTGRIPVFSEIPGEQTFLGRMVRGSLAPYKSSDEYTRVVAALAAKEQWDSAVQMLAKGEIRPDQFMEFSCANMIDAPYQNQIIKHLQNQQFEPALDIYLNRIVRDTMFDYRPAMRPRLFNSSAVGKIFGQYGTYPVNYLARILKGFRNGTKAQKVAFATRWLVNSFGLYSVFQSIGINATNFLPWQPLQFTGGPVWNSFITATQLAGAGYQGREARGQVKGLVPFNLFDALLRGERVEWERYPQFLPGSMQYRDIWRAVEFMQDGNYMGAANALMSAPTVVDGPDVYDIITELYPEAP